MPDTIPHVIESGYTSAVSVAESDHRLLTYSPTDVRFEHRCDRGPRGVIVCAPRLTAVGQPGGHQVSTGPTVSPSVLCTDCGTHGWIRNGKWIAA